MTLEVLLAHYQKIWKDYESSLFPEILKRGFLFQFDGLDDRPDILFIGINPSFDKTKADLRQSYKGEDVLHLPYFKAFESIKSALESKPYKNENITWAHLDLLVFRETNQKFVNKLMKKENKGGLEFIVEQLKIAKELIKHINPKVIVVSNAMARRLMGKDKDDNGNNAWMDYHFEFDKKVGADKIKDEGVLSGTPVFFSSMLSGQRALDNGSKERLIWHINRALDE